MILSISEPINAGTRRSRIISFRLPVDLLGKWGASWPSFRLLAGDHDRKDAAARIIHPRSDVSATDYGVSEGGRSFGSREVCARTEPLVLLRWVGGSFRMGTNRLRQLILGSCTGPLKVLRGAQNAVLTYASRRCLMPAESLTRIAICLRPRSPIAAMNPR